MSSVGAQLVSNGTNEITSTNWMLSLSARWKLLMQGDGNLVGYDAVTGAVWYASATGGSSVTKLKLETSGAVNLYAGSSIHSTLYAGMKIYCYHNSFNRSRWE